MPENLIRTATERSRSRELQIATRWLRMQRVIGSHSLGQADLTDHESSITGGSRRTAEQSMREALDLFVERRELRIDVAAKERVAAPAWTSSGLSLEEKREIIRRGNVNLILPASRSSAPHEEVIARSKLRIEEIERRLDLIFAESRIRNKFISHLGDQVRLRRQAREARALDRFVANADLISIKLTRDAQVQSRTLSSVERRIIAENRVLAEDALHRRIVLLNDPEVFDLVRILELKRYRDQLRHDRFAETPSRIKYLERIERAWAEGKRVSLTGETGTGKTEMIKHASNMLFGVNPETVTGHQDLSIYELLGKTGFRIQVGDVFRPAPLIVAMTGRDGKGQPFLFDEIDRAPNQAVMGIKTILNARPGERGVKVQIDTAGRFDVGPDYAVAATANIKSEKYATATELDPSIVRIFDAPIDVDYMPAYEVYDLALAALMDKWGGVPLSEDNARFTLRNLCDAASWIQDAYQGRKVITDPASEAFLEARGQATIGKIATLKKALLDPGRTLDMLRGWTAEQTTGIAFEDYINERVLEFINNRAYPEEDRYYLIEVFALKGFLRGRSVTELMVSGLDQSTLERWAGFTNGKRISSQPSSLDHRMAGASYAYLPWNRVARLDPYRRFQRPVSQEAEELLTEEAVDTEVQPDAHHSIVDRAQELLGRDFLGVEAIRKLERELRKVGVDVEFSLETLPPFPYTEEDLQAALSLGEMLVLRPRAMVQEGKLVPMTLIDLRELLRRDPLGAMPTIVYSLRPGANDWYKEEEFAIQSGAMEFGWALTKKAILEGSTNTTWNEQEHLLRQYEADLVRKGATNVQARRRTALEAVWDIILYYINTGERLLPYVFDWGQTRPSDGPLVCVGGFDPYGLRVYARSPERSYSSLGMCPSR